MGGSNWSNDAYQDRQAFRSKTGTSAFVYDNAVKTGAAPRQVNPAADPKLVAGPTSPVAGQVMRESRDSADHPESLAIGVLFDVTGSMGEVPKKLQKKLGGLMALLLQKGYVPHPQILFGAIGDANTDQAPLQIGQFESGLEMDDDLGKLFLEGNGGGQSKETYELGHYFFARHTVIDCFEKRGVKGYLFTMGDEGFYPTIRREHVEKLIGDKLESDLKTEDIVRELEQKFHVFHIIIEEGGYPHNKTIEAQWKDLLNERVLLLEDAGNVTELIAMTIGLNEGTVDLDTGADHLVQAGLDPNAMRSVTNALVPFAHTTSMSKANTINDLPEVSASAGVERL
jgi:hypothetical protein